MQYRVNNEGFELHLCHSAVFPVYRVSLKTGDEREAGTNAVIHAEVVGSEGSTGKVYLPDEEEFFERGLTDSFQVSVCIAVYFNDHIKMLVIMCVHTHM